TWSGTRWIGRTGRADVARWVQATASAKSRGRACGCPESRAAVPSDDMDAAELDALRDRCTRFLNWHGPGRAAEMLADIPPDTVPDRYGDGGVVAELEGEVAALLGKPSAGFLPSGTMAQQATVRV